MFLLPTHSNSKSLIVLGLLFCIIWTISSSCHSLLYTPLRDKWASGCCCCSSDAYVVMYSRSTQKLTYVSILLFLSKASQSPHVHIYRERERDWCVNSPPFWCLSRTIAMCAQIMMLMVDTRVEDPLAQLITIIVLPTHCHRRGGGEERRGEKKQGLFNVYLSG